VKTEAGKDIPVICGKQKSLGRQYDFVSQYWVKDVIK
jgi:hypothetical protein